MDTQSETLPNSKIKIAGLGWAGPRILQTSLSDVGTETFSKMLDNVENLETICDIGSFLKDPKTLKLMAKQDRMALFSAAHAAQDAKLDSEILQDRCGIYFSVGILPFEQDQLDILAHHSTSTDGTFDIRRFSTDAFRALNPVLTFRCLPNMPVFHVSLNLGIQNTYYITYPGPGQWYQALQRACQDLKAGRIRYALVGAVADRRNALVRYYVERANRSELPFLIDTSCTWALTCEEVEHYGVIENTSIEYCAVNPLNRPTETSDEKHLLLSAGPVDPSLFLSFKLLEKEGNEQEISLHTRTVDGMMGHVKIIKKPRKNK